MEFYSSSYGKTNGNFILENIRNNKYDSDFYGIYCVVNNIIQRGNPTRPSEVLTNHLGILDQEDMFFLPLLTNEKIEWVSTIKGYHETNDNPAKLFFDKILSECLTNTGYSFVIQLILPEAKVSDIIHDYKEEYLNQKVDFYIPCIKTVIEIDGMQHLDIENKLKDKLRDQALAEKHIDTIRITAQAIKNKTSELKTALTELKLKLDNSDLISKYKEVISNSNLEKAKLRIQYDIIMRFQILMLRLLQNGQWRLSDTDLNLNVINNDWEGDLVELIKLAYEDIMNWIRIIAKLRKMDFHKPKLFIGEAENSIKVDFSIYKKWTDGTFRNNNLIYIRNDYFDDENYFILSTADSMQYRFVLEGKESDYPELEYILRNIFGFQRFNNGQLPIITNALERIDTVGILPTGSGKSLCYQFAAILQPCISLVVCPIISLMRDQKHNLDQLGIVHTEYIAADKDGEEKGEIRDNLKKGKYLITWISPERFQNIKFRESIAQVNKERNFAYAVIDEVHCLSEWGHDFRTSYLTLVKTFHKFCPEARLLGLTATASKYVIEDIKNEFGIDVFNIKTISSMDRDELVFHRIDVGKRPKIDVLCDVLSEISRFYNKDILYDNDTDPKCGLIFTINVGSSYSNLGCIDLSSELSKILKTDIKAYHGQLNSKDKEVIQDQFINNKFKLLIATKAFGMGINKKDIKYTIHYSMPQSVEAFYQEAGRAGRDEDKTEKSHCYILFNREDCSDNILNELFAKDTTADRRKELQKKIKGDLNSIIYLWNKNKKNVDEEYEDIRKTLKVIHHNQSESVRLKFNTKQEKEEIELALYKLSLLGFVDDWTIEYGTLSSGSINAYKLEYSEESVERNLIEYIKRSDPELNSINNLENKEKYEMIRKGTDKKLTQYIKILLTWINENILYSRLQSTHTMMKLLIDDYTDDDFRKFLEAYFSYTDMNFILDEIVYNPKQYISWFRVFFTESGEIIKPVGAESLLAALRRYLESYQYNTGLNFINGLAALLCNKVSNDDIARFTDAIKNIITFEVDDIDKILDGILNIGKNFSKDSRNKLGNILVMYFQERARKIYNELKDDESLFYELNRAQKNIKKLEEKMLCQI